VGLIQSTEAPKSLRLDLPMVGGLGLKGTRQRVFLLPQANHEAADCRKKKYDEQNSMGSKPRGSLSVEKG